MRARWPYSITEFIFTSLSTLLFYYSTKMVNPLLRMLFQWLILGFSIVCYGCGRVLYNGNDMIPLYQLRCKTDNRCSSCQRKLAQHPINITYGKIEGKEDVCKLPWGPICLQLVWIPTPRFRQRDWTRKEMPLNPSIFWWLGKIFLA